MFARRSLARGLALALLVAAPVARAQEGGRADALADPAAREAIRAVVARLDARGVPTAPLATKVREGLAKQAPPARIAVAVEALATRLEQAHAALAIATSTDEVAAGAGALQGGVSATTLRELRQRWPQQPLTVPLGVLTQMVASGVPVPRAVQQVRVLLERGATPTQLVAFGAAIQADVAAGIAPDVAIVLRGSGVSVGVSAGTATSGPGGTLGNSPPPPVVPIRP